MKLTKKQILELLTDVLDPELNISIVDLGLVYDATHKNSKVHIKMTLTTIGCPLFDMIDKEVRERLKKFGIKEDDVEIELTFDPPWSMEMMSPRARAMLGI